MSRFQTTRWSLIDAAREDPANARDALELLCRAYRPPVLAFILQSGLSPSDAEDLTQEFFTGFLERGWYASADPRRGRFRSLLLTSLRHFLADRHAHGNAHKRGRGLLRVADAPMVDLADPRESPEQAFTRTWLVTIVARAMTGLQAEWRQAGKGEQFERLAPLLIEHADSQALQAVAEATGLRRNTLAVQLHRMRQRLRQLMRLELVQTVGSGEALDEELADLRNAIDPMTG